VFGDIYRQIEPCFASNTPLLRPVRLLSMPLSLPHTRNIREAMMKRRLQTMPQFMLTVR
jgi:hypothetical protein